MRNVPNARSPTSTHTFTWTCVYSIYVHCFVLTMATMNGEGTGQSTHTHTYIASENIFSDSPKSVHTYEAKKGKVTTWKMFIHYGILFAIMCVPGTHQISLLLRPPMFRPSFSARFSTFLFIFFFWLFVLQPTQRVNRIQIYVKMSIFLCAHKLVAKHFLWGYLCVRSNAIEHS